MDIATLANTFMPMGASITGFLIVSLHWYYERHRDNNRPVRVLWFYFCCCMVNWSSVFIYFHVPNLFVVINSLAMFTFIMVQVLFYKFLFLLTRTDPRERFSKLHFLIPVLITLLLTILMAITPFDTQKLTVMGRGKYMGGSHLFFVVSNSKMAVRLIFSIVYTLLCLIRLHRYRKRVENLSANYDKSSLHWVKTILLLSLSLIPIPLLGLLLPRDMAASSALLTAHNAVMLFQYSFLCFHVVRNNFIVFDQEDTDGHTETDNTTEYSPTEIAIDEEESATLLQTRKSSITKEEFEDFIMTERPFLDPDLRLFDLANLLNTNRTYLSSFINSEYAINFNRLINRFRMRELERLRKEGTNKTKTEKEMVEMVGFGSHRNFKRYEAQEDDWH